LLYTEFYAAPRPVIVGEGLTDNIYLHHAIQQLAKHFPLLAQVDPVGTPSLNVRLFKYTRSSTNRVLGISGGTGQLAAWMSTYLKSTNKFHGPGKQHPVILVADSDSGAHAIWSAYKSITGKTAPKTAPFTHVYGNLYIVPLPLKGATAAVIETCFDPSTLAMKVNGKTLSLEKSFDKNLHFGKAEFAKRIVAAHASTIQFRGFSDLLTNISAAIQEHRKMHPPVADAIIQSSP
jgi:hypothetical protein